MRHLEPERDQKQAQLVETVRIGTRVNPIKPGNSMSLYELCGLHVGCNHAFLDQPMGVVPRHNLNALDFAVIVELETGLRQVEFDCASSAAGPGKGLVKRLEFAHRPVQVTGHRSFRPSLEQGADLTVRQARLGAHHGIIELGPGNLALRIDAHFAHHAKAVYFRVQRAQAVGQNFGQHRDDAIREIHGRAAPCSFRVQRRPDTDVVRDICNSDKQAPAGFFPLAVHGIVKVAGVSTVNRHQVEVTQIVTPFLGTARHGRAEILDFFQYCGWPVTWNGVPRFLQRPSGRASPDRNPPWV